MIRRSLFVVPLAIACLFASQAIYAFPVNGLNPTHSMFARSKTVKVSLYNASASSMDLRAGDTVITLKAGETITVNLPAGTHLVTNTAGSTQPAGALILDVSPEFNGTTVTLH